jgi:adenylate cyclase, class 2
MLEVENKYRHADWQTLRQTLESWGAVADPPRRDTDHYFNAPDRDFAQTDEALRLRRIGLQNILTYKGPKQDKETKTRLEIELNLGEGNYDASQAVKLITHLGYKPVAVVTKTREILKFDRHGWHFEICFDDVGMVGKFVEIETLAEAEKLDAAKACLLKVASELGLTNLERRSYLELLLMQPKTDSQWRKA